MVEPGINTRDHIEKYLYSVRGHYRLYALCWNGLGDSAVKYDQMAHTLPCVGVRKSVILRTAERRYRRGVPRFLHE